MGRVIEIPLSRHPVRYIFDRIKDRDDLWPQITVVFPGKRPILYLRKMLSKHKKTTFLPPRTFSMEGFLRELHHRYFGSFEEVSPQDAAWEIYDISRQFFDRKRQFNKFSRAFFWAMKFFEAFEELEKNLVDDRAVQSALEQPEFLLEEFEFNEFPAPVQEMLARVAELRTSFRERLKEKGMISSGMIYREVAEQINEKGIPWDVEEIYFVGLSALTRAEEKIISYVLENYSSEFIYQNCQGSEDIFSYLNKWNIQVEKEQQENEKTKIELYEGFDMHSQAAVVGKLLEENELEPHETVVVLPDSSSLMPLLSSTLSSVDFPYNISMGYPLTRTPVYALLDRVMTVQEESKNGFFRARSYLNLILHPYIKNLYFHGRPEPRRILLQKIQDKLTIMNKPYVSLEEVEGLEDPVKETSEMTGVPDEELKKHLEEINKIFIRNLTEVYTLKGVAKALLLVLETVYERSPARFYTLSSPFFEKFMEFFLKIERVLFANEILDPREAFSIIRNSLLYERIPFEGIPLEGLQVLGQLETRALRFKNVIFLNANEDILPDTEPVDPVLPTIVRKYLGLPTYKDREKIIRYYFMRLVKGAERAFILYSSSEKTSKSRFIEELVWEEEKKNRELIPSVVYFVFPERRKPIKIEKRSVINKLHEIEYSPTKIDTYLQCPLRFYFSEVLGLRERGEIEEGIEARQVGNFLHVLLKEFYENKKNIPLTEEHLDFSSMERLFEKIFSEFFPYQGGEFALLKEVAKIRVQKFLEKEKQRLKKGFEILMLEQDFKGTIEIDGVTLNLKGRVDRIHREGNGEIVIVDYKTGSSASAPLKTGHTGEYTDRKEMKKRIKSFQLPIYVYLVKESGIVEVNDYRSLNAALYSLGGKNEDRLFKGSDKDFLMEKVFIPSLRNLLKEIINPEVPFVQDLDEERYCEHCPFRSACSI